jgi:hypothetical protein
MQSSVAYSLAGEMGGRSHACKIASVWLLTYAQPKFPNCNIDLLGSPMIIMLQSSMA